jgi:hypothetical protein
MQVVRDESAVWHAHRLTWHDFAVLWWRESQWIVPMLLFLAMTVAYVLGAVWMRYSSA